MRNRKWTRKKIFISDSKLQELEKEASEKGITVEKYIRVNRIGDTPRGVN